MANEIITVVDPSIGMLAPGDPIDVLKRCELAGRICYRSEDKITEDSFEAFLRSAIARGHESILEHGSITLDITCDRAVANELTRHRVGIVFSQESTRYCKYNGGPLPVIRPAVFEPTAPRMTYMFEDGGEQDTNAFMLWYTACVVSAQMYNRLMEMGVAAQDARAVLPLSLATRLIVTANIREWRTILKLRCAPAAHPEMRRLMLLALLIFHNNFPVVFDDLYEQYKELLPEPQDIPPSKEVLDYMRGTKEQKVLESIITAMGDKHIKDARADEEQKVLDAEASAASVPDTAADEKAE